MRELRNVVERALSLGEPRSPTSAIRRAVAVAPTGADGRDQPRSRRIEPGRPRAAVQGSQGALVESFEREYLEALLARHHGNISRAAAEAGIDRNYIHRLVKKYGLEVDRG